MNSEEDSNSLNQQGLNGTNLNLSHEKIILDQEDSNEIDLNLCNKKFICHVCKFGCNRITHWNTHINTKKHLNNEKHILDNSKDMDQLLFKIQNETIRNLSNKIEKIIHKDKDKNT